MLTFADKGWERVWKMATLADNGGEGFGKMLTLADKGGKGDLENTDRTDKKELKFSFFSS